MMQPRHRMQPAGRHDGVVLSVVRPLEEEQRVLAFELGQWGITCNSFGATPIMTDMIRGVPQEKIDAVVNNLAVKRLGTYEDCSNVCDFFISRASDNITGQVVYLGGVT